MVDGLLCFLDQEDLPLTRGGVEMLFNFVTLTHGFGQKVSGTLIGDVGCAVRAVGERGIKRGYTVQKYSVILTDTRGETSRANAFVLEKTYLWN